MAPDQTDRRSRLPRGFSGFQPEARHPPRRPCGLSCGLGVSDPSPQAPPRQARRISSFSQFKVLLNFFQKIAGSRGSEATEVWVPDQTSGAQAPFFGGLLGPTVRSAAKAATPPQFALRARGQCPLPVCPSPASWQARPDRAQCSGVLRHSLGRVRGPVWAKNRSGRAVTCVSFPPSQRRAPFWGIHKGEPPYVCFLSCFLHKQKTSRPPGRDRASSAACGTLLKKVRYCTAVHPPPSSGGIRGCKSALSMSACLGARGSLRGVAP